MMSRDVDGKDIVQVGDVNGKEWLYRDSLNEEGKLYADVFEATVKIKSSLNMPVGTRVVPVESLPERHRPKFIKGIDIVDPDDREAADPVWPLLSFLRMLEEYRDRKDYFAISPGELEEANSRFQETDEVMKDVSLEEYNGEELNKTFKKRKYEPGRPLTSSQLDMIRKRARNYVPAADMLKIKARKYDKAPKKMGGLRVLETTASSTRSFIKDDQDEQQDDEDYDEDDDYEGDQSEAEEAQPKFKRAKTLKSALFDKSHF